MHIFEDKCKVMLFSKEGIVWVKKGEDPPKYWRKGRPHSPALLNLLGSAG